jgi:Flp pilus assembly protein TadG
MVEGALALMVFGILVAGIMELGLVGFASNSISFAAQRAARYAAVRGSASGHAATVADVEAAARSYAAPLKSDSVAVAVTWTPPNNNNPGSKVQVRVEYAFRPSLLPLARGMLRLQSTARQTITQ